MKSPITTHILDTSRGRPAHDVPVRLEIRRNGTWIAVGSGQTDDDGRVSDLLAPGTLEQGVYRLTFETATYFAGRDIEPFYPHVSVDFEVRETGEHYHVPLLLNPFGYTTYRGS